MKIINTALCSFGSSGLVFHAPFIDANPGFKLYAVWERTKKNVTDIYPEARSFDTLESMLADELIELVIVNTPNYTHFDYAKKALLASKHVLVEKSFTVTVSEAEELIHIATKMDRQLSVFQNRRYDSDFKTVKKIVEEGLLGDIIDVEFNFDRYKPALSPKLHKESAIPGAGLLYDLGPHLIDQALCLFGLPESVFGFLRSIRKGSLVNDYFNVTLFYSNITIRLKSSLMAIETLPAYILHGTKGNFTKKRADLQEEVLKTGKKPGSADWGIESVSANGILSIHENEKITHTNIQSLKGNYMEFYDRLYEAIVYGKYLPVTAQDGLNVMRVIEAVQQSDHSKKVINL